MYLKKKRKIKSQQIFRIRRSIIQSKLEEGRVVKALHKKRKKEIRSKTIRKSNRKNKQKLKIIRKRRKKEKV